MWPQEFVIVAVADGLGGMSDGGGAAELTLSAFCASIVAAFDGRLRGLADCAHVANKAVYDRFRSSGGATLSALVYLADGETLAVNAGDSRLYEFVPDLGLSLLTRDDTLAGVLATGDQEIPPDNRLLQFCGVGADFSPHVRKVSVVEGVTWLLTSDGTHNIGKGILLDVVSASVGPSDTVRRLLTVADAVGVRDNATVIAFSPGEFEPPQVLSGGLAIHILTPSDKVEMWLPLCPSASNEKPDHPQKSTPDKARPKHRPADKLKRARTSKTVSNTATVMNTVRESSPEKEEKSNKPQLSIVFAKDSDK